MKFADILLMHAVAVARAGCRELRGESYTLQPVSRCGLYSTNMELAVTAVGRQALPGSSLPYFLTRYTDVQHLYLPFGSHR